MKLILAYVRVLFAAIILIAVSAIVGSAPGFAAEALGSAVQFGVAVDCAALSANASDHMTPVGIQDRDDHRGGYDCRLECVHAAGSGCCVAGISAAGEYRVIDRARASDRVRADKAFLVTGLHPEALLQPPRFFA